MIYQVSDRSTIQLLRQLCQQIRVEAQDVSLRKHVHMFPSRLGQYNVESSSEELLEFYRERLWEPFDLIKAKSIRHIYVYQELRNPQALRPIFPALETITHWSRKPSGEHCNVITIVNWARSSAQYDPCSADSVASTQQVSPPLLGSDTFPLPYLPGKFNEVVCYRSKAISVSRSYTRKDFYARIEELLQIRADITKPLLDFMKCIAWWNDISEHYVHVLQHAHECDPEIAVKLAVDCHSPSDLLKMVHSSTIDPIKTSRSSFHLDSTGHWTGSKPSILRLLFMIASDQDADRSKSVFDRGFENLRKPRRQQTFQ